MKIVYFGILVFFCIQRQQSYGAVVRKQPAYSTPVYSNAYLPAAMQVIFHAVSQLKDLDAENIETLSTSTTTVKTDVEATSPHAPGQHQPIFQDPPSTSTGSAGVLSGVSTVSIASVKASPAPPIISISDKIATVSSPIISPADPTQTLPITDKSSNDASELNAQGFEGTTELVEAETPEQNYATPEINHEVQEPVQEVQEAVQEMVESNQEEVENTGDHVNLSTTDDTKGLNVQSSTTIPAEEDKSEENSSEESDEKKNSSEESDDKKNSSDESDDKSKSSEESKEDQNDPRSLEESKQEKLDSSEEEDEEIRFTLIGEKVSQVPRPSLSNYLRKTTKSPLRNSTQELASLYDALSKDARRQGFAQYNGYSDEVLQTLESSAEGGIGPQIRILLERTLERKELTRDDAKTKLSSTLKSLRDPATILSRDLRRLIPLRYIL